MKATIIIPTYNENENIEKLLKRIFALGISNLNVIVVDDDSPDGTADTVENLSKLFPIKLIKRHGKLGLGSAYIAGFKLALADCAELILEMDADFSHDPNDIPRLIAAAQDVDLVIGSRKIPGGEVIGWGWMRKLMSNGAMWFSRTLLCLNTKDVTAGFRCFHCNVLKKINLDDIHSNGYAFQEELLYRTQKAGFKIKEIPVTFVDRRAGKSKLSNKDVVEFFIVMANLIRKNS